MPNEAAAIIYHCEQCLGHPIPEEDLHKGALGQYLKPEDYQPIQKVTSHLPSYWWTLFLVLGHCMGMSKTRPLPPSVKGQLTNFCKS